MSSFICRTCGESHEGLPADFGWQLPDVVWAMAEPERSRLAKFDSDRCQFGDRFFIRCVLPFPFSEQPGHYRWGVWAEVEAVHFWRYIALYDQDARSEPDFPGAIANVIPGYPSTLGLPVRVQLQDPSRRPTLHIAADDHPLARHQASGISNAHYHDILTQTGALGTR
ncbi:MAG TPA: DUF2199 domain-containing protein [Arenimonas sp.]|uniref:DUF2199 domain-containing protein n=1 Tax=Arenimonas sp. TaxID=1872635 RepID=UPI002D80AC3A|nr:DUF2199 domain-containing protein [Arenimonas sp.]HEU0153791.1 DUF2199 domain-containing protein [Arenimonas sp.]